MGDRLSASHHPTSAVIRMPCTVSSSYGVGPLLWRRGEGSQPPLLLSHSSLRLSDSEGLPATLMLALTAAAAADAAAADRASATRGGRGAGGANAADAARAAADALYALAAVLPLAQRRQLWPLFSSGDRRSVRCILSSSACT